MLVKAGADPNMTDEVGLKPVQVAAVRAVKDWTLGGIINHMQSEGAKEKEAERNARDITTNSPSDATISTKEIPKDVTSKIISFTKDSPRSVCILSAIDVISHVTLRHASSSVGTVTYEGRFEILSLSGSFTPGEFGVLSQETKMSITLSSPDGRVVGGQLGGLLTAVGPVQTNRSRGRGRRLVHKIERLTSFPTQLRTHSGSKCHTL